MMHAEVFVDHQHGPAVRVAWGDTTICLWLMDETAIVTNANGQFGIEVSGPWHEFKSALIPVAGYQPIDSGKPAIPPGDE